MARRSGATPLKVNGTLLLLALFRSIPAQTPETIHQDFATGVAGWEFLTNPPFQAPGADHSGTSLDLLSDSSGNGFGFWESPRIQLVHSDAETQPGNLPLWIPPDRRVLISVKFQVHSDQAETSGVPQLRLRVTTTDSQQADMITVASNGSADFAPSAQGRTYELVYCPAPHSPTFQAEFEVLDFDTSDAAARISLDSIDISRVELDAFDDSRLERHFTFSDGLPHGWLVNLAPGFASPDAVLDFATGAIGFGRNRAPDQTQFAWWGSPEEELNRIPIEAGRLYYATWGITTSIPDPTKVPSFRCRLNESSMQGAAMVHVASTADGSNAPRPGDEAPFCAILPPGVGAGGYLIASFDFLSGPADDDAASGDLLMKQVIIGSTPWPARPPGLPQARRRSFRGASSGPIPGNVIEIATDR